MASLRRFKVIDNYRDPEGFHGRGPNARQYQPRQGVVYQKLTPEVVCDLLERSDKMHNGAALRNLISARQLLERMSNHQWTCTATAHEGGQGGRGRAPDPYLHFNVLFEDAANQPGQYHVRCHQLKQGGLYVFQVTF